MQIRQEQQQKQIISQQMIQLTEILQVSGEELSQYLEKVAMENPVMELEKNSVDMKNEKLFYEQGRIVRMDEQSRINYQYDDAEDFDYRSLIQNIGQQEEKNLKNLLMQQLMGSGYSEKEMIIFEYIALCLNSNGYFTMEIQELAQNLKLTEDECKYYLNIMRNLEPAGICAGSLRECLLKQIEGKEEVELEKKIIEQYLDLLGKNQLLAIAKETKTSIDRVKQAQNIIQCLNPKPARGYSGQEYIPYIEPDIIIMKFENHFEILVNDYSYPILHINKQYLQMLRSDCPKNVKDYLSQKISQVKQIQDSIAKRTNILTELANYIMDVQKNFFLYGEQFLSPDRMKDAAKKLSVHESTISRAVKNKYLQCCWGMYPLKFFFSRGIGTENSDVATFFVKKELERLIASEDKQKPYNDQKLSELLKKQGLDISRRTVAKYREAMGIANSRERKVF